MCVCNSASVAGEFTLYILIARCVCVHAQRLLIFCAGMGKLTTQELSMFYKIFLNDKYSDHISYTR